MQKQAIIQLSDGRYIPQVGLGVWKATNEEAANAVKEAIKVGYRHIDTAAIYQNEVGVGKGIQASGIDREDVFVTTKVWNSDQGYDSTLKAFDASLEKLGMNYVDLYLIHWPLPKRQLFVNTWKALIRIKEEGRARSIGVANFEMTHIERIVNETGVKPVINQIEVHPRFQQRGLRQALAAKNIVSEAWSPLGQGQLLTNTVIEKIAKKHQRSAAQIIIRWHIEQGNVVIPKSVHANRIADNFNVFDFSLDQEDNALLAALDDAHGRIGSDPLLMDKV